MCKLLLIDRESDCVTVTGNIFSSICVLRLFSVFGVACVHLFTYEQTHCVTMASNNDNNQLKTTLERRFVEHLNKMYNQRLSRQTEK